MPSISVKSATELQRKLSQIKELAAFETTIVLQGPAGSGSIAQVSWLPTWKPPARLSLWQYTVDTKLPHDVFSMHQYPSEYHTCADLQAGFAKIFEQRKNCQLVEGTLAVSLKEKGADPTTAVALLPPHFLSDTDSVFQLTQNAWFEAFSSASSAKLPNLPLDSVKALQEAVTQIDRVRICFWIRQGDFFKQVEIITHEKGKVVDAFRRDCVKSFEELTAQSGNIGCALHVIAHACNDSEFLPDTLKICTNKSAPGPAANEEVAVTEPLYILVHSLVKSITRTLDVDRSREMKDLMHMGPQSEASFKTKIGHHNRSVHSREMRKTLLQYLSSGKKGIKSWNEVAEHEKSAASFADSCLKNLDLSGLKMEKLNFENSKFDHAQLKKAAIKSADFSRASFIGADLSESKFSGVNANHANFSEAILKNSKLHKCSLQNAVLAKCNVEGCDFKESDLRGVDLTSCNAAQAMSFSKAVYDESTRLPQDFPHWKEMLWKGKGPDPYKMRNQVASNKTVDFADFIKILNDKFDQGRLTNALSMLKEDRFQLFSDAGAEGVLGVIKSQTDSELVYACRLGCDGRFACCTQNLNPCGGLKGALCKHILLLIVALGKAGVLDTSHAAQWALASKNEKPFLDKEAMTDIFLRYEGAQRGELDWRPTETMPEDYYAI